MANILGYKWGSKWFSNSNISLNVNIEVSVSV